MSSGINLDAMVAKIKLDRPMNELVTLLTDQGRYMYAQRGETLPFDFDKQCRLAIRRRKGNPVPAPTNQVALRVKPGELPAATPKKSRNHKADAPVAQPDNSELPIVIYLRRLRTNVLASKIQGEQLQRLPTVVADLKKIFGLDIYIRNFGGKRMIVVNGIAHITSFILSGQAQPEEIEQASRLLDLP